jgi:ADP-ribosylglycohydrolase
MLFTDDTTIMLQAAVVLVNSAVTTDTLTTVEDLDRWYAEYMHTEHRAAGAQELDSVRAVRHILWSGTARGTGTCTASPPTRARPPGSSSTPRWR